MHERANFVSLEAAGSETQAAAAVVRHVPGFLSSSEVRSLRRYVLGLGRAAEVGEDEAQRRGLQVYRATEGCRAGLVSRFESFVEDCAQATGIDLFKRCESLASGLLKQGAVPFKDKINLRWPREPGYDAHQDAAAGWDAYAPAFATVVIFLAPSSPLSGGFQFGGSRSLHELFPHRHGKLVASEFDALELFDLVAQSGDAAVFSGIAPHRSHANGSSVPRAHLLLTFCNSHDVDVRSRYYADKLKSMQRTAGGYAFRLFSFEDEAKSSGGCQ